VSLATPAGRPLLSNFSHEFLPGTRVGIAGPNGAGKSSLLSVIAGTRQPQVC
jgi:ATPase subunit of ABC transporter with duplicated ATPase domains